MKKLKVYEYAKCGTCVKAKKFLEKNKIFEKKKLEICQAEVEIIKLVIFTQILGIIYFKKIKDA